MVNNHWLLWFHWLSLLSEIIEESYKIWLFLLILLCDIFTESAIQSKNWLILFPMIFLIILLTYCIFKIVIAHACNGTRVKITLQIPTPTFLFWMIDVQLDVAMWYWQECSVHVYIQWWRSILWSKFIHFIIYYHLFCMTDYDCANGLDCISRRPEYLVKSGYEQFPGVYTFCMHELTRRWCFVMHMMW